MVEERLQGHRAAARQAERARHVPQRCRRCLAEALEQGERFGCTLRARGFARGRGRVRLELLLGVEPGARPCRQRRRVLVEHASLGDGDEGHQPRCVRGGEQDLLAAFSLDRSSVDGLDGRLCRLGAELDLVGWHAGEVERDQREEGGRLSRGRRELHLASGRGGEQVGLAGQQGFAAT